MTTPPVPTGEGIWKARVDGGGPEHQRWGQRVFTGSLVRGGVGVIGFGCDAGVRRNHGRPGAAAGPDALRRALAPLAVHGDFPISDVGTVHVTQDALEEGQARLGAAVRALVDTQRLTVVLGGGHETAYGSYLGRSSSRRLEGKRVGVISIDAHFDLRRGVPSSGTPFRQMAEDDAANGRSFRYLAIGIAESSNTRALFNMAHELDADYLLDLDCTRDAVTNAVATLADQVDAVHLSIDLDALPAAVAPGVSAPAGMGLPLAVVNAAVLAVAATGRLVLVDVAELAPVFDTDGRTARTAASLITTIAHRAMQVGLP